MSSVTYLFFFNDTATTEIYTLSLHDALPIWRWWRRRRRSGRATGRAGPGASSTRGMWQHRRTRTTREARGTAGRRSRRSEEHTSELQSRQYLVCRLLLEKKKPRIAPLSLHQT